MSITTKNNLVALVIRNPSYATSGCGFFFFSFICQQPALGVGKAVEEKERERNIYLFLGLEIGIEGNK